MKKSKFKKVFFILWASLCGLFVILLTVLGFYLNDFEKNRPERFCEELLKAYQTADCDVIYSYFTDIPDVFKTKSVFKEYIDKYLPGNELYYFEQSASTDEVKQYDFMVGKTKFASLTISPTGEKSFFNQVCYSVSDFEEFAIFEYSVIFADGITVFADGSPVDSKFLTETNLVTDRFTKIGKSEYNLNKYVIDEFTFIKNFTTEALSDVSKVAVSEHDFEFYLSATAEESEEVKAFCREFYKKYAVYVTLAYQKIDKVLPYIHSESDFGDVLSLVDNRYGEYPKSYRFENEVFSNLYKYSETDYSIEVSFELVLVKRGSTRVCPFSGKVYLSKTDDGFKVVDMEMI